MPAQSVLVIVAHAPLSVILSGDHACCLRGSSPRRNLGRGQGGGSERPPTASVATARSFALHPTPFHTPLGSG